MPLKDKLRIPVAQKQPGLVMNFQDAVIKGIVDKQVALGNFNPGAVKLDDKVREKLEGGGFDIVAMMEIVKERLRREKAKSLILQNWRDQGGPASRLGLPLDGALNLIPQGSGFIMSYRGGNIHINGDLNTLNNDLGPVCRLTFEGLILHSRQETSMDEIYGGGGYRIGSIIEGDKVHTANFVIPEVNLGGKDNMNTRVYQTSTEIYRGPAVGLELFVAIAEHDSGNREDVRKEVRMVMEKGAKAVGEAVGAGFGGLPLDKLGAAGEQLSQDEFGNFLLDAVSSFVTDLLGLADDPYTPGGVTITADEMLSPPMLRVEGHQDDNKTISYTHKISMSGVDDANATGNCSAYFRVWR